jgi:hypothetical protein
LIWRPLAEPGEGVPKHLYRLVKYIPDEAVEMLRQADARSSMTFLFLLYALTYERVFIYPPQRPSAIIKRKRPLWAAGRGWNKESGSN